MNYKVNLVTCFSLVSKFKICPEPTEEAYLWRPISSLWYKWCFHQDGTIMTQWTLYRACVEPRSIASQLKPLTTSPLCGHTVRLEPQRNWLYCRDGSSIEHRTPLPHQAALNDHIHEVHTVFLVWESESSPHTWVLKHLVYGLWASLVAQTIKNLPIMWETRVQFLGQEGLLEKGMATHCSILVWRVLWTEEPGGL